MNNKEYHKELRQKIKELRQELTHRQSRLKYNIITRVCKKSIESQQKVIKNFKTQIENIEYIIQHNINDYSQIPQ